MKHNYKIFLASITMLVLHATMVMGANIIYSLTTHVDGRTITGSVDLAEGANLNDNMPQAFWRAYCTYKYYSDEAKTQEITTAPATASTVYVDYVFEPPFRLSVEGANWYYYFNAFIGGKKYYMCNNLGAKKTSTNDAKWAIYGDAYCLNLKAYQVQQWLTYTSSAPVIAGSPMLVGWQLYYSTYKEYGEENVSTLALGSASNDNMVLHYDNDATSPGSGSSWAMGRFVLVNIATESGFSKIHWDEQHQLVKDSGGNLNLHSNTSFFFAYGTYNNIYETTWKILQADGTWANDIRRQKDSDYPRVPFMPSGWSDKNTCTYDRYYKDAAFTDKYEVGETIPASGNTVLYIKESYKFGEPFVTDHWITLALSYGVNNLANEFGYASDGVSPAVRVLEYTALKTNAENTKYTLTFTETSKIEAHKPYLFKADEVLEGKNLNLSKDPNWGNKQEADLISYVEGKKVAWKDQTNNSPYVTMIGTYLDKELTVQSQHPDLLYFYFGYDKNAEAGKEYNFYRVTKKNVTIHPFHCYFMIEGAASGAKFMMMDNFGNEITSVEGIDADSFIQTTGRIYNLNGQMMGTDLQSLPRGIYIVNGKKVMK